jgi:hypothetical protein
MRRNRFRVVVGSLALALVGCGGPNSPGGDAGNSSQGTADSGTARVDSGTAVVDSGVDPGHEGDHTLGRLAVSFADGGQIVVIDLDDRTTSSLAMSNPPALYGTGASTAGVFYGVQRTSNRTQMVKSGVEFDAHDDHFHITKTAPSLMPAPIVGALPTHFTYHPGWAVFFNDGDGTVDYARESELMANAIPLRATTGRAHHGVAVLHEDRLIATRPDPTQLPDGGYNILPDGVTYRALSAPDTVVSTHLDCPNLHGEHTERDTVAIGCGDGVLLLTWQASTNSYQAKKLTNPASVAGRVGTVEGHSEMPVFIGNYDLTPANGLAIIDPSKTELSVYQLPTRRFGFKVSMHGDRVLVLTQDGLLHRLALDAAKTSFVADGSPLQVMPAFATYPSAPAPQLAIGWERAYVSDPRDGTVKEVSIKGALTVSHTFTVGGAATTLAVTSVSPDWHDH